MNTILTKHLTLTVLGYIIMVYTIILTLYPEHKKKSLKKI